eukprot:PhM_4_TR13683/c0_g4_i1/m.75375
MSTRARRTLRSGSSPSDYSKWRIEVSTPQVRWEGHLHEEHFVPARRALGTYANAAAALIVGDAVAEWEEIARSYGDLLLHAHADHLRSVTAAYFSAPATLAKPKREREPTSGSEADVAAPYHVIAITSGAQAFTLQADEEGCTLHEAVRRALEVFPTPSGMRLTDVLQPLGPDTTDRSVVSPLRLRGCPQWREPIHGWVDRLAADMGGRGCRAGVP